MSRRAPNRQRIATETLQTEAPHRYAIDYFKRDGTHLGPIPIEPDFQTAKDWTYFIGVRGGKLPAVTAAAEGRVSPLWCEDRGAPYCRGIRVEARAIGHGIPSGTGGDVVSVSCEFPKSFFKAYAERASQKWVAEGKLAAGERYTYFVCAYPLSPAATSMRASLLGTNGSNGFDVEVVADPLPLYESELQRFRERATKVAGHSPDELDRDAQPELPVFFAEAVIEEASALAAQTRDRETGGVLVGRLHRDVSQPEIFIEIVAQIPARHAEASGTSFSFTPETWGAAAAAIELRGRNELVLGWWHFHPLFCDPKCPKERRKACYLARPFFSADDIHLHRVCFPQPYQVALLISDLPDPGLTPAVFGWRSGVLSPRDYFTIAAP